MMQSSRPEGLRQHSLPWAVEQQGGQESPVVGFVGPTIGLVKRPPRRREDIESLSFHGAADVPEVAISDLFSDPDRRTGLAATSSHLRLTRGAQSPA
jgi:hypothetical protein